MSPGSTLKRATWCEAQVFQQNSMKPKKEKNKNLSLIRNAKKSAVFVFLSGQTEILFDRGKLAGYATRLLCVKPQNYFWEKENSNVLSSLLAKF